MRYLIYSFLSFIFLLQSNNTFCQFYEVELNWSKGAYPIAHRRFIGMRHSTDDNIIGIPNFLKDYKKYKIKYKSNESDSLNYWYAICGIHDGKKIVLMDTNGNQDLSDDKLLTFSYNRERYLKIDGKPKEFDRDSFTLMDNYDGNEFFLYYRSDRREENTPLVDSVYMEIQSGFGVVPNPQVKTSVEWFDYTFVLLVSEYRHGRFFSGKDTFELFINPRSLKDPYRNIEFFSSEGVIQNPIIVTNAQVWQQTFDQEEGLYHIGDSLYKIILDTTTLDLVTLEPVNKAALTREKKRVPDLTGISTKTKEITYVTYPFEGSKHTLIHFWGSWCGPCKDGFPSLVNISNEHKKINIIGVATEREYDLDGLNQLRQKYGLTWLQLCDDKTLNNQKGAAKSFDITTYPTYLLISPDGKELFRTSDIEAMSRQLLEIK